MMAGDMAYLMRQGASKLTLGFHKIEQPAVHEDESTRQVGCVDRSRVDHLGSEGHAGPLGFGPQSLHDAAHVSGKQGVSSSTTFFSCSFANCLPSATSSA